LSQTSRGLNPAGGLAMAVYLQCTPVVYESLRLSCRY